MFKFDLVLGHCKKCGNAALLKVRYVPAINTKVCAAAKTKYVLAINTKVSA